MDKRLENPLETRLAALPEQRRALIERLLKQKKTNDRTKDLSDPATIPKRPPNSVAPLSFAQQRLWFLDQLVPNNAFYNIDTSYRITLPLDLVALERSFNEIVRRHEVLRTSFPAVDGEARQMVAAEVNIALPVIDLSRLPDEVRNQEALRIATEEARRPFNLATGPLLRTTLLRLADNDHILLITIHHIASDGWSMNILRREFNALYPAFFARQPSPLPPLPIQYADFALWQRAHLQGEPLQKELIWWKRRLENLSVLRLPTDHERPTIQSYEGARQYRKLGDRLTSGLRQMCRREEASMFVLLLTAFIVLLNRYTDQTDIVVGVPVANRNRREVQALIGFFVNTFIVRVDVSGNPSFSELLGRVRDVVLTSFDHQDLPFEKLVEELQPERSTSRNPLFDVAFQLLNVEGASEVAGAVKNYTLQVERASANADLAVDVFEDPNGITVRAEYSTDLFVGATIERMLNHYETLLSSIVADSTQLVSAVQILPLEEKIRMLVDWNSTTVLFPRQVSLHRLVSEQAARTPHAIALTFGSEHITYGELESRSNQLARYVMRQNPTGAPVAVAFVRSPAMVVAVLGVLKSGSAYVPIDPEVPARRREFILKDVGAALLVTDSRRLADTAPIQTLCIDAAWPEIAQGSSNEVQSQAAPNTLAYIIYTSGSTGTPKGVMIDHRAVCGHLFWMQRAHSLGASDRVLLKYSLSVDVSVVEIFHTLMAGAQLIITEPGAERDMAMLAQLITDEQITALDLVPSMLERLLEEPDFWRATSLRRITCGGEVMSAALLNRLFEAHDVEFNNMYGPTEATITATAWNCRRGADVQTVPIGRPIANTAAYILDAVRQPVPIGVPGELYISGAGLARGYVNRSGLTSLSFVPNPFPSAPAPLMYRTGDVARYLADGNIEFLGRVDDQVKVRGVRIEPAEIEHLLAEHAAVLQCAVVPSPSLSESSMRLVAYIVPARQEPEFWPSVGEHKVYDDLLYQMMTRDELRNAAYRRAIGSSAAGKIVVDIGTGADAVLARMCAEAGAERIYAIERDRAACERARSMIASHGLSDRIVVIEGDTDNIELPEAVDVSVSDLIGTIGSSEGVVHILNRARRYLRANGTVIPRRCATRIAAVSLPIALATNPTLSSVAGDYTRRIFEAAGGPFDLRVCVKDLSLNSVVSDSAVFEELDFSHGIDWPAGKGITLTLNRTATIHGCIAWIQLHVNDAAVIDSLHARVNWLPVFLPLFYPGLDVAEGDVITMFCSTRSETAIAPDYRFVGTVTRRNEPPIHFDYLSRHRSPEYRATPFYSALFEESRRANDTGGSGFEENHVSRWCTVFDSLYSQVPPTDDPMFNITGWNSSYTGKLIPETEMREQVAYTAARILDLPHENVLEVGCGTGLLLFRIAPNCRRYVGLDISDTALEYVRGQLTEKPCTNRVELLRSAAHELPVFERQSFNAIILNSVVQYFPSVEYLVRVLESIAPLLAPGGRIFIGDVRNLRLLEGLYFSVELQKASPASSCGGLCLRIARRVAEEQELCLDPGFFPAVARHLGLDYVSVELKRGRNRNELTDFRYDAVLGLSNLAPQNCEVERLDWNQLDSMDALGTVLESAGSRAIYVRAIANLRVMSSWQGLSYAKADRAARTSDLVARLDASSDGAIAPDLLWEVAAAHGRQARVGWSEAGPEFFDVLFERPGFSMSSEPVTNVGDTAWGAWANSPFRGEQNSQLLSRLRSYLAERVPEQMIPCDFVVLDGLPTTTGGKVDRRALASVAAGTRDSGAAFVAPRNEVEIAIAAIWQQVLGISRVGIHGNFFAVGGHSLLATQVASRLRTRFGVDFQLRELFEHPTISEIASALGTRMAYSHTESGE